MWHLRLQARHVEFFFACSTCSRRVLFSSSDRGLKLYTTILTVTACLACSRRKNAAHSAWTHSETSSHTSSSLNEKSDATNAHTMSCSMRSTTSLTSSSGPHESKQKCCVALRVITVVFGVEVVFPVGFLCLIQPGNGQKDRYGGGRRV